jgi:hypothetical protein
VIAITEALASAIETLLATTAKLSELDVGGCPAKAQAPAIAKLAAKPSSVEMAAGKSVTVVVKGGQPSYHGRWVGATPPAAELADVVQSGDTFRFQRVATSPVDYIYEIIDSTNQSVELTIKK